MATEGGGSTKRHELIKRELLAFDYVWTSIMAKKHWRAFEVVIDVCSPDSSHLMIPSHRQGTIPRLSKAKSFLIPKMLEIRPLMGKFGMPRQFYGLWGRVLCRPQHSKINRTQADCSLMEHAPHKFESNTLVSISNHVEE